MFATSTKTATFLPTLTPQLFPGTEVELSTRRPRAARRHAPESAFTPCRREPAPPGSDIRCEALPRRSRSAPRPAGQTLQIGAPPPRACSPCSAPTGAAPRPGRRSPVPGRGADPRPGGPPYRRSRRRGRTAEGRAPPARPLREGFPPVSYTHLTLPTILRV